MGGEAYHGQFILSVVLAVLGVASQMIPYFCVARIVSEMINGGKDIHYYMKWCLTAFAAYMCKVIFSSLSTAISHTATYHTLRDIRKNLKGIKVCMQIFFIREKKRLDGKYLKKQ
ncbi:MAG: hypothetical protein Q4B70_04355 [Lachnospiraceae bacterium]|nr:hypothetical protein [Lachnospiraceae bacterium]